MDEISENQQLEWVQMASDEFQRLDDQKKSEDMNILGQRSKKTFEAFRPRLQQTIGKAQWSGDDSGASIELSAVKKLPPMKSWLLIDRNVKGVVKKTLDYMPFLKDHQKASEMEQQLKVKYSTEKTEIQDMIEDKMLVKLVNECFEKQPEIGMPPTREFFKAVKEMLGASTDSKDIRKRFANCSGLELPAVPAENEDRVSVLKSHFCRVCFLYGCKIHSSTPMPTAFEKLKLWENEREGDRKAEECSGCCYKLDVATGGTSEWTEDEIYYFKTARKSQRGYFCGIAHFIPSKTCQEVFEFAQRKENYLDEPQPDKGFELWSESKSTKKPHKLMTLKKETTERSFKSEAGSSSNASTSAAQAQTLTAEKVLVKYVPCDHAGPCGLTCPCVISGNTCEKLCRCSFLGPSFVCGNRFPGCRCEVCASMCACRIASRECDPDSCKCKIKNKFAAETDDGEKKYCTNRGIQLNQGKRLLVAVSDLPNAGFGCFTQDAIKKGEFISEYKGELVSFNESERRSIVYDFSGTSYNYELDDQTVVDAADKGNEMRFANHARDHPNCNPSVQMVNGERRIGLYASRNIQAEEELMFDYGVKYPEEMLGVKKSGALKSDGRKKKKAVRKIKQEVEAIKTEQKSRKSVVKKMVKDKKEVGKESMLVAIKEEEDIAKESI